jgi:hypothetical protein
MDGWLESNVDIAIRETDTNTTHNVLVAVEKELLPRSFNVEAGAYINTIRTSLDLLATALAYRHNQVGADDAYFPVATSAAKFLAGQYKGAKFVKRLPVTERQIIESLKPYEGGNDALWLLHHLDIVRKHRRLLDVSLMPQRLSAVGAAETVFAFVPVATGYVRVSAYGETILGLLPKGRPKPNFKLAASVLIDEPGMAGAAKPLVEMLNDFASLANSIIRRFDV